MTYKFIHGAAAAALMTAGSSPSAYAGEIWSGPSHAGAQFTYDSFEVANNTVIRFAINCNKNWGGGTSGVAQVIAFFVDSQGKIDSIEDTTTCIVKGGVDGARKRSHGATKTLTIPAPKEQIEARAFIAHDVAHGIRILEKLESEINNAVEQATQGVVKKPLSLSDTLESAVIPVGGHSLGL